MLVASDQFTISTTTLKEFEKFLFLFIKFIGLCLIL